MIDALILVDIQNDFLPPHGSLAVPDGRDVIPVANKLIPQFDLVIATQDWHPSDHISFASQHAGKNPFDTIELDGSTQTLWPDHCVQHSEGAELSYDLSIRDMSTKKPGIVVIRKGTRRDIDSYSGFYDNRRSSQTDLLQTLKYNNAYRVYVIGLATDVCVMHTVIDGCESGLRVYVVQDGCRGLSAASCREAYSKMEEHGAMVIQSNYF